MSEPYVNSLTHPVPARRSKIISDTADHTNLDCDLLVCLTETVIASITAPRKTNYEDLVGKTLAAGTQIPGPITQLQLTNGDVEAHGSF